MYSDCTVQKMYDGAQLMKTKHASEHTLRRDWWIIDAKKFILGKMATKVATRLRGKHKTYYTPHVDTGDFVVVINAEKVIVSGDKANQKIYWRHTGYPGGEKGVTLATQREKFPERIIFHAVRGMLPKGTLGRKMLKKLKVYAGENHPHKAQKPKQFEL